MQHLVLKVCTEGEKNIKYPLFFFNIRFLFFYLLFISFFSISIFARIFFREKKRNIQEIVLGQHGNVLGHILPNTSSCIWQPCLVHGAVSTTALFYVKNISNLEENEKKARRNIKKKGRIIRELEIIYKRERITRSMIWRKRDKGIE